MIEHQLIYTSHLKGGIGDENLISHCKTAECYKYLLKIVHRIHCNVEFILNIHGHYNPFIYYAVFCI